MHILTRLQCEVSKMKRKISVIVTVFAVILSIALVALLGIKAAVTPVTVRVERIAFVNEEGGEITRKRVNYTPGVETMVVRYKVFPEDATDQRINVIFDDFGAESQVECLPSLSQPGIIDIDFKGELLDTFSIKIISVDSASVEAALRFVAETE